MTDNTRKIAIHIRNPKHAPDIFVRDKASAHLAKHEHAVVPAKKSTATKSKSLTVRHVHNEPSDSAAAAMAPALNKLAIPKKPLLMEGISMGALSIAYFSMEVGIEHSIPTYAGGLGILAGDMLRSAADLSVDVIGVSLLYRKGYFHQRFDESGWQIEEEENWDPTQKLVLLPGLANIVIEGRSVVIQSWLYKMRGVNGHVNPIIFLDTDVEGNSQDDRAITAKLYAGDRRMRLMQEAVLGVGGFRMLQTLGATSIEKFHMNEGHSALLTLELYRQYREYDGPIEEVRKRAVFTTHTPIAAGHDLFDYDLVISVLGKDCVPEEIRHLVFMDGKLHMTHLGFSFSGYHNGVAKKHSEVTRELFPGYRIESITNGIHTGEWVSGPIAALFDHYIPGWRLDAHNLRYALVIPTDELWAAHQMMKVRLCDYVHASSPDVIFDPNVFTIGFARRATSYKRGNMLFRDVERLKRIAEKYGGIQVVYAGKSHPNDRDGKLMIQEIIRQMGTLNASKVKCVYLPNYDIELAKLLVAGVDIWLNTPMRPMEASGTSGMKAAVNGVPHFSTLDGWWLEGHIENVTGWSIGPHPEEHNDHDVDAEDSDDLYKKLEYVIIPRFEGDKHNWVKMMRSAIAINGSFFNTQRMVEQYVLGAYFK